MAGPQLTNEETISLISKVAAEKGDDFIVKVLRRASLGSMPVSIGMLSGAQVVHAANPEVWVPKLFGGGPLLLLDVRHVSNTSAMIGSYVTLSVPTDSCPVLHPDANMLRQPGWTGPTKLDFPTVNDRPVQSGYAYVPPSLAGGPVPPSISQPAGQGTGASYQEHQNNALREQISQMQREAVQREREFAEERRRNEEERRRNELDAIRKENDARMAALEAKLLAAKPAESGGGLKELAAVFAPVVQQVLQGQNEVRALTMKMDADRSQQNQAMLVKLLEKPAIDPTLLAILDKSKSDSAPMASMLHTMAESQMTSAKAMMEMVRTAADLGLGGGPPKENFALAAVKEGVKGLEAMMKGYAAAVYDKSNPKRPGLPAGQPQSYAAQAKAPVPVQARPQAPQPRVAVLTPAQATREAFLRTPEGRAQEAASMIGRESPAPQPQPVPVQQFPRAVPQTVVAEPQGEVIDAAGPNIIDEIESDIKEHTRAEDVAKKFLDALEDPVMKAALDEFGGQYEEFWAKRLLGWVMSAPSEHGPYVKEVLEEVNTQGLERGVFEDEEEEGGEPEDATA